jgi:hypothetical protein
VAGKALLFGAGNRPASKGRLLLVGALGDQLGAGRGRPLPQGETAGDFDEAAGDQGSAAVCKAVGVE